MKKNIESEAISSWAQKSQLEKALMAGMHGAAEFKHDEKVHYLGEFKENVIKLLTHQQVAEPIIYPEIIGALKDKQAAKMIIDGSINLPYIEKYKKLAIKMNKPYTVRSDKEFKGTVGLLVISDEAVDSMDAIVEDRSIRLKRLGMSSALINAVGKKLCKRCLEKVLTVDPKEEDNYHELTFLDRISGEHCPAHQQKNR